MLPLAASDLTDMVRHCTASAPALAALAELYDQLDASAGDERCLGGGACCRFDLAGHRLFVTGLELALLTTVAPASRPQPVRCPYQVGPRCRARRRRPLGCRTYWCAGVTKADLYETLHKRIKALHQKFCLPYAYVELTGALDAICCH